MTGDLLTEAYCIIESHSGHPRDDTWWSDALPLSKSYVISYALLHSRSEDFPPVKNAFEGRNSLCIRVPRLSWSQMRCCWHLPQFFIPLTCLWLFLLLTLLGKASSNHPQGRKTRMPTSLGSFVSRQSSVSPHVITSVPLWYLLIALCSTFYYMSVVYLCSEWMLLEPGCNVFLIFMFPLRLACSGFIWR